jgi:hypothetical protein
VQELDLLPICPCEYGKLVRGFGNSNCCDRVERVQFLVAEHPNDGDGMGLRRVTFVMRSKLVRKTRVEEKVATVLRGVSNRKPPFDALDRNDFMAASAFRGQRHAVHEKRLLRLKMLFPGRCE